MNHFRYIIFALIGFSVTSAYSGDNDSTTEEIKRVRVFSGYTISKSGTVRTPSTITIIETENRLDCRFIAFVEPLPRPLAFRDVVAIAIGNQKIVFRGVERLSGDGVTQDPRGFLVSWEAELIGTTIRGNFKQPFDEGTFHLREEYAPEKSN